MSTATKFLPERTLTEAECEASRACVDAYLDGLREAVDAWVDKRISLSLYDYYVDELHAAKWTDNTLEAIEAVREQLAAHS